MNRYQELMGAIEPSEDFKSKLTETVLTYRPKTHKVYRPKPQVQMLLLILLIALALVLVACAAYVAANWDPIFVEFFSPTASQAAQLENAVETVEAVSHCGDVTLSVRQTLGDDKTIYVILDITFPDSVPLRELLNTNSAGKPYLDIMPGLTCFGSKPVSYDDIADKSFFEIERELAESGSILTRTVSVDLDTNTATYLACLSLQTQVFSGKPLTLFIDNLVRTGSVKFTDMPVILEGPFLISWTPSYTADSRTYEINDSGGAVGYVTISPISLKAELYHSEYRSFYDFAQSISQTFKNGKTCIPENSGLNGAFNPETRSLSFDTQFTDIVLPDEVKAINIGGYTVKLD